MIQRLEHTNTTTAERMHHIFQESYSVEAKLLNATDFPPLQRTLDDFINSKNAFYGFYMKAQLVAVIEITFQKPTVHIQSLVVLPEYFRMGIASSLLSFILASYPSPLFTVETGLKNVPANLLYRKFGFIETEQWDTDHGARKVRLEKRVSE